MSGLCCIPSLSSPSPQVSVTGNIVIEFTPEEKPRIIMWYFQIQSHVEYISRSEARQLVGLSGGVGGGGGGALIGLIGVRAGQLVGVWSSCGSCLHQQVEVRGHCSLWLHSQTILTSPLTVSTPPPPPPHSLTCSLVPVLEC